MERDLDSDSSYPNAKTENNFDCFQKTAAIDNGICYNGSISQSELGCTLQAKEGVLV